MQRRKLISEKLIDGELTIVKSGNREEDSFFESSIQLLSLNSTQKFLVTEAEINASSELIHHCKAPEAFYNSFKVPYNFMAIEEITNIGIRMVHLVVALPKNEMMLALSQMAVDNGTNVVDVYGNFTSDEDTKCLQQVSLIEQNGRLTMFPCVMIMDEQNPTRLIVKPLNGYGKLNPLEARQATEELVRTTATLCTILNIKNASNLQEFKVPDELSKARIRRGKKPLHNYTYVHMLDGANEPSGVGESELSKQTRATHMRRGHFKNTRTGMFWWNAHKVGVGETVKRDAYIV